MPDDRTTEEKLAAMANQTASPHEAEVARRMLAALRARRGPDAPENTVASAGRTKTRRVLTEDAIFGAPDGTTYDGRIVKLLMVHWNRAEAGGATVLRMRFDEVDWELMEANSIPWKFENEKRWHSVKYPQRIDREQILEGQRGLLD